MVSLKMSILIMNDVLSLWIIGIIENKLEVFFNLDVVNKIYENEREMMDPKYPTWNLM